MEHYLSQESTFATWIEWIAATIHSFYAQVGLLLFANIPATEHGMDREAINQQAEQMLNDYGNHILRLAYSYLHNMSDAEEILQDTLIQFLKTTPVFESKAHEKAWLLRVAANLSKNRV